MKYDNEDSTLLPVRILVRFFHESPRAPPNPAASGFSAETHFSKMADLKKQTEKHLDWWRRENVEPLVINWYPQDLPFDGLDVNVPVDAIHERALRNAEFLHEDPALQDGLICSWVNFATALYPAAAGADYHFDPHTSWTIPKYQRAADVRIPSFDPGRGLYAEYRKRVESMLEGWSWDTYLPTTSGYDGPGDILAGFLGPEVLAMEIIESPEDVRAVARDAAEFMCEVIAFEKELFQSAGMHSGMATLFNTFHPGWAGVFVEDFSALIGPNHYRDIFLEFDRLVVNQMDAVLFHTHSAGYRNIPVMLELPEHVAFEFGNDPNGPDTAKRIDVVSQILQNKRPVVFGSWSIPLPVEEMEPICTALPASGLNLRFQCGSREEAIQLYDAIKSGEKLGHQ
jgi:hypothetical protein